MNKGNKIIHNLDQRIDRLEGHWNGMTKQRFFQILPRRKKNMGQLRADTNISQALTQIATKFRQTDQA
ncbi:WXG100 family type VII secretion target [Thermoactinomyces daqus]|uniref:WXG100 family type VII secretion target n=1 Tax=Thermoactinomyces daqus TaxID=1329516 RepID=A0A7W1X9V7_9BACL|nr:WXG100 family type VII secretion target [Thermoactinomyces daqus]